MLKNQAEEVIKCCESFEYFCEKYVNLFHPVKGLVPFKLEKWQARLATALEENRFVITKKWRQGGLATTTLAYCCWLCMFKPEQRIVWLSNEPKNFSETFKTIWRMLPDWLRPRLERNYSREKKFSDTGSEIVFERPASSCKKTCTHLVIDEAAYIPDMEFNWKCYYPTLAAGGKCFVMSTTADMTKSKDSWWFFETYTGAKKNHNYFHVFESHYLESSQYQDKEFAKRIREALGEKGWLTEVEQSFLLGNST